MRAHGPLDPRVQSAYRSKLDARLAQTVWLRGHSMSSPIEHALATARQIVLIPLEPSARSTACGYTPCAATATLRISTLTETCTIWPGCHACTTHAMVAHAYHLLVTLPDRVASDRGCADAAVDAAVRFLFQAPPYA